MIFDKVVLLINRRGIAAAQDIGIDGKKATGNSFMQQVFGKTECEPEHKGTEVVTLIRLIHRQSTLQEKSPRLASPGKSFIALFRDRLESMHGALSKRFIHVFALKRGTMAHSFQANSSSVPSLL